MLRLTTTAVVAAVALTGLVTPTAQAAPRLPSSSGGHYVGAEDPAQELGFDAIVLDFDVKAKTRKIKNFTISMNVVCSGYPLYTEYVVQPMNPMKINPRTGKFSDVVSGATEGGTTYRVEVAGTLKGRRVKNGTMSYDVGVCQRGTGDDGPVAWKAARTGR